MRRTAVISVGTVAAVVTVAVAVAVAFNLLVARGAIRDQLEAVLTATFETPVSVGRLNITLLPDPSLTARQITFARLDRTPNLSVAAVHVDVGLSQLWRGELVITELRLEDVTGGLAGLMEYVARMSRPRTDEPSVDMALRRILASPVRLLSQGGRKLGPYELAVQFGAEGELMSVTLARLDSLVRLNMARGDPGSVSFGFMARDWRIPYGPPLTFGRVDAVGRWLSEDNELEISDLRVGAYGGALAGQMRLGWGGDWRLKGQALLEGVDAGAFLSDLGRSGLTGRLDWDVAFELRSPELAGLFVAPEMAGDFRLRNGALVTRGESRGKPAGTPLLAFDDLEGQVRYAKGRTELRRLRLRSRKLSTRWLGPYEIKLQTAEEGGLHSASLRREDDRFELLIRPADGGHRLDLDARRWVLPVGPPLRIDRLELAGQLTQSDRLRLDRINAKLYDGQVEGKGSLAWKDRWTMDLNGRVADVDLAPLLAVFDKRSLTGRFNAKGEARLASHSISRLFTRPVIYCDFSILEGAIHEVDLQRAAQNLSDDYVTGGETGFEQLSGRLYLENGMLTVDDLRVASAAFEARGQLAVTPQSDLYGEVNVGIRQVSTLIGIPVRISGTTQEPRLRPTNAAIAGAAAGTAVLGPGLGTALGIKAGQAVKKLSEFLSRAAENARAE